LDVKVGLYRRLLETAMRFP